MRYAAPELVGPADAIRSIEETRVHHAHRRRGGGVAGGSARSNRRRFRGSGSCVSVPFCFHRPGEMLRVALCDLGYGKSIVIELRWAERVDQLPEFATELVGM